MRSLLLLGLLLSPFVHAQEARLFRQLKDTVGITFNQLAAQCPRDGQTPCSGSLAGWVWATEDQVVDLLEESYPEIRQTQSADPVPSYGGSGQAFFFYASNFFATIKPTQAFYLTYATSEYGAGLTATLDINGVPMVGYASTGSTPVSIDGSLGIGPMGDRASSSPYVGAFLWRDPNIPLPPQPQAINAVDDVGKPLSPSGGISHPNILANDTIGGQPATLNNVNLSLVPTASADIALNLETGAVSIGPGAALGSHSLVYKICEKAFPANCDSATVRVEVRNNLIYAGPDYVRASSKKAATLIANVLSNDTLNGARATLATVSLSQVSSTSSKISLDANGAVKLSGKVDSTNYKLLYRICEKANPSNCAQGTVSIELSGGG